jgi:hypothetical protein
MIAVDEDERFRITRGRIAERLAEADGDESGDDSILADLAIRRELVLINEKEMVIWEPRFISGQIYMVWGLVKTMNQMANKSKEEFNDDCVQNSCMGMIPVGVNSTPRLMTRPSPPLECQIRLFRRRFRQQCPRRTCHIGTN